MRSDILKCLTPETWHLIPDTSSHCLSAPTVLQYVKLKLKLKLSTRYSLMTLGIFELFLILAILAVFFGWGRMGNLGGSLGKTIRAFKEQVNQDPAEKSQPTGKTQTLPPPQPAPVSPTAKLKRQKKGVREPSMVEIEAGTFLMGTNPQDLEKTDIAWTEDLAGESPAHELELPRYAISRYPITNAEYKVFVEAGGVAPAHWDEAGFDDPLQPVVGLSWYDALAYCRWLSEATGKTYTLPSEAEWEKAARGTEGRIWPWGNRWAEKRCHSGLNGADYPNPVGGYSTVGDSPYGLADVAGNIWEWTRSLNQAYPYHGEDGRENLDSDEARILRGGSWQSEAKQVRCAERSQAQPPAYRDKTIGFRVVQIQD
jgi:formylglycine-generating enzyme required for sulfatase activity